MDEKYKQDLIDHLTAQKGQAPTPAEISAAASNPNVLVQLLFTLHEKNANKINSVQQEVNTKPVI